MASNVVISIGQLRRTVWKIAVFIYFLCAANWLKAKMNKFRVQMRYKRSAYDVAAKSCEIVAKWMGISIIQRGGCDVILMTFSSLTVIKGVNFTIFGWSQWWHFVKMATFCFSEWQTCLNLLELDHNRYIMMQQPNRYESNAIDLRSHHNVLK